MTDSRRTTPITFVHPSPTRDEPVLDAFSRALDAGATGIEAAVRLSADRRPVLATDRVLRRGLRRGLRRRRVDRLPAGELSSLGVPDLGALFETVGPELHVRLELNDPAAGEAVLDDARSAGGGRIERVWLVSPDLDVLRRLRRADDRVRLVHSGSRTSVEDGLERHAYVLSEERVDAFTMHRREWSTGLVVLFHRFDVLAFAGDTREVRHLREALAFDVDAVSSDQPDRMVATVAEWTQGGD